MTSKRLDNYAGKVAFYARRRQAMFCNAYWKSWFMRLESKFCADWIEKWIIFPFFRRFCLDFTMKTGKWRGVEVSINRSQCGRDIGNRGIGLHKESINQLILPFLLQTYQFLFANQSMNSLAQSQHLLFRGFRLGGLENWGWSHQVLDVLTKYLVFRLQFEAFLFHGFDSWG